ncbi:MAG: SDR family NAD(P)-dependent oxidoreductase [Planctomycetales bacterium]|nr:SDR family NAD(P)-dependent oxidoreductase [Planctomycetales bacterium]
MAKPTVLIQLDADPQPSTFDGVVAVDAGVAQLFRHGGVTPDEVRSLVHGAMFTRGAGDMKRTAIFIGGSDVAAGEQLLAAVTSSFFGPLRVSVMLDANGANTTAAAAVLVAARHVGIATADAVVLGATGPVGRRVVRLLAGAGARVRAVSRSAERAAAVVESLGDRFPRAALTAHGVEDRDALAECLRGANVLVAAGAAGVELIDRATWSAADQLQVAIDLNAVPPLGIEGVDVSDDAEYRDGKICYGALGVGGVKMHIHKAAIRRLFESNDHVLDAEQILVLGSDLGL